MSVNWRLDVKYGEIQVGFIFYFWRDGLVALMGGVLFFRLESPVVQLLISVSASPDTWAITPISSAALHFLV